MKALVIHSFKISGWFLDDDERASRFDAFSHPIVLAIDKELIEYTLRDCIYGHYVEDGRHMYDYQYHNNT